LRCSRPVPGAGDCRRWTGCRSGGLQRVFGLAKERLNRGCSGGLRGGSALQKSYLKGIALGVEKAIKVKVKVKRVVSAD